MILGLAWTLTGLISKFLKYNILLSPVHENLLLWGFGHCACGLNEEVSQGQASNKQCYRGRRALLASHRQSIFLYKSPRTPGVMHRSFEKAADQDAIAWCLSHLCNALGISAVEINRRIIR